MYVKKLLFLPILFAQTIFYAAVNDPIPTDYEAVPVGKTVMSVNYLTKQLHSKAFGSDDNYIKQSTYALRYTHGFNLGGKTIGLGFAIPYTYLETQGSDLFTNALGDKTNGLSDIVMSATYWYINDKKNRDYLASTITLALENGEYDKSNPNKLNPGENRYKATFAIGYITKISNNFIIELVPEVGVYSENKTTQTKQNPSYALSSSLRYKPNSKYELFLGAQENYQGNTTKQGISQNNEESYEKYRLGAIYYTDKFNQWMIRAATDTNKEFGTKTKDEILLRYRWWF